ncbi:tetratricopeptide repeat-containing sensor histidine kinase [Brumimicrobium mesophilum]|uniref:tetratricopeptide repeat-containing sensor histidine kinase n=1 Tax=Brumimicrobium mesophilum TaxID=392717 RepID=UPI000D1429A9|nr:ATP-binding protein [Brumimicrobium mesophilum]
MKLNLTNYGLILLSFLSLLCSFAYSQGQFSQDSMQIVKNAQSLLQHPDIKSVGSVKTFLNEDVKVPNEATSDLINYYMARHFYITQQHDLATDIALKCIEDDFNENSSDAKFYNIHGAIHVKNKDYEKGIKSFLEAAEGFKKQNNSLREHVVYNNIANIHLALGDHDQAYHYSKLCYDEYQGFPEDPNYLTFLGILIVCENNLEILDNAKIHIDIGMKIADTSKNIQGKVLLNFATSEWEYKKGNYDKAKPLALKSLELSEKYGLKQFQIMNNILLMDIHNDIKQYQLALDFGLQAKANLEEAGNLSMEHTVSNGMSVAYAGLGLYKNAYLFKKKTDSLKTIDRDLKNKRNMDSLLVQFESLDNKNEILNQEITIATQNNTIERRNNILIIISFTLLITVLFIIGIFFFNRQRLRLIKNRQEAELINAVSASEEEERNRLSSLLHDGLAAELTALKLELERLPDVSERAYMMLDNAHKLTRRVSHNLSPYMIEEKGLVEAIAYSVSNNNVNKNLFFYTNTSNKLNISSNVAMILFRSTQELLQNAIKHAHAKEIVVQVMLNERNLTISVEDDGVGMDIAIIKDSIGLGSLRKRIEVFGAELNIDSSPNQGTSAFINLKLEK